jgi:anti-anti-sigma regulatory factor
MPAGFPSADRVERVMTDRVSKFFINSWDGDVAILKLTNCTHYKMSDIEVLEAFRRDLLGFLDKHEPAKIIVDFSGLWRIDCLSLGGAAVKGVLISAKRRSERWHTLWKFYGMSAPVRQCHELSRLDSIFPMYDSHEKAMAAFSGAK